MKVFITGASSGLGAALAAHYAARGALLGIAARRSTLLAAQAQSLGANVSSFPLDVTDRQALKNAADAFVARHGVPDLVIANAGVSSGTEGGAEEDIEILSRTLAVNVTGLAATLSAFIAPMKAARRGTLVGIASVAGLRGFPGSGAYSASKAAAIAWLEALRIELRGTGVSVLTICPGYIDTPMTAVNRFPMPFLLSAEEAASKIARTIERGQTLTVLPWQMRLASALLRRAPNWVFDRLFAHAPRKPRGPSLW